MTLGIVGGLLRKVGGGTTVIEYATVSDLNTAAAGVLPAGYYSVPNAGVTYWDGVSFFPYLSLADAGAVPLSDGRTGFGRILPIYQQSNLTNDFEIDAFSHASDMDL